MASTQAPSITIDYYTDVLCIWAWIAQPRLDELHKQYGSRLDIRHRFVDIFGDSHRKILSRWGKESGFARFADHVLVAGKRFEHCNLHQNLWRQVRPRSSLQAHIFLKAVQLAEGNAAGEHATLQVRRSFFCDGHDISRKDVLVGIAEEAGLDSAAILSLVGDGSALAALSNDLQDGREQGVRGSPTWVINEGRQILYGNVGYRILAANVDELLRHPGAEASWC